jgi:flagellar M-ring protein FliF
MEQKAAIVAAGGGEVSQGGGGNDVAGPFMRLAKTLGPGRILALGAVACCLLGFFAYVIARATEASYTLLFSGLELADAQELVGRLEAMAVPFRLSPAGDAIMVPSDDALRLRMALAEEGLPHGGKVGYELFDQANPLTTSDFLANVNLRRAVEGELARTVGTLRGVRAARVHIVEPKRSLFGREEVEPSASIVVSLRGPTELDKRQIAGIRHLIAAAVPGLQPKSVTVLDDAGNLLAEPSDLGDELASADDAEEHRVALENRLRAKIVQLLERTVGPGKADAAVSADLDFDEVATTAELFDPASQVVRSTQTTEESSDQKENQAADAVSVANNLPTERAPTDAAAASSERTNRTEETVNYEISRTVRNQAKRGASIRKLSIAVQVDGAYRQHADGTSAYEPRSAEELSQLAALVRSAAGVDEGRGDVVEIVSRPFVSPEALPPPEQGWRDLLPEGHDRLVELAVLSLLTLAVLLFGVRPALRRLLPAGKADAAAPETTAVVLGADGRPLLVHGATGATIGVDRAGNPVVVREPILGEDPPDPAGQAKPPGAGSPTDMVTLKSVRGQVHASLLSGVAEAIETSPEDAVRVVRAWLHEG